MRAALKGTRTVPEEVVVERSLSKGQGLDKMAELVAMASGVDPRSCALGFCIDLGDALYSTADYVC